MMLLMLAAFLAADRPVVVSSLTTEQLVEQCRGKDDDPTFTFCTGYIIGEFDTLSLSRQICPSSTRASNIEAVAAVRKYLRKHAKKATGAPAFVVRDALRAAYPCKRK
jgi:Rap1a immunity proteins